MNETTNYDNGLVPIGAIMAYALPNAPKGWLFCDGTKIKPQYQELITLIGPTTPNLIGQVVVGAEGTTKGSNYPLNATGGEETHKLSTEEMPKHSHSTDIKFNNAGWMKKTVLQAFYCTDRKPTGRDEAPGNTALKVQDAGGSKPHNNMQPYVALNYIIYTGINK